MTSAALANIANLYPQNKEVSLKFISQIIDIALSSEIREYDSLRWGEDAMDGVYNSQLYEKILDLETGLYYQSAGYNYELLRNELLTGKVV